MVYYITSASPLTAVQEQRSLLCFYISSTVNTLRLMLFQLKAWVTFALTSALLAHTVIAGPVETHVIGTGTSNTPLN